MRKIKLKLIAFLMVISLFTVAFATWNIYDITDDKATNGSIKVDEIKDFDEFADISFDEVLVYNENGFFKKMLYDPLTKTFSVKNHNETTATISININKIVSEFKKTGTIKLRLALRDLSHYEKMEEIFDNVKIETSTYVEDVVFTKVSLTGSGSELIYLQENQTTVSYAERYIAVSIPVSDIPLDEEGYLLPVEIKIKYSFNLEEALTLGTLSQIDYDNFFQTISTNPYRDSKAFKLVTSLYIEYQE